MPSLYRAIKLLIRLSPATRSRVTRHAYELMARCYRDRRVTVMNYGYAALQGDGHTMELRPEDELNRYPLQLYHHLASKVPLAGRAVLDVGAGRGGGAAALLRYLKPSRVTGVEVSPTAVELSRSLHDLPGLSFLDGDAEALPVPDESFDVVVNVESSHCYGSMARFLEEVRRVLRPGGAFLFGDVRDDDEVETLRGHLARSGLEVREEEIVTPHVVAALERTSELKEELIRDAPVWARRMLRDQTGVQGGAIDRAFREGRRVYLCVVAHKA